MSEREHELMTKAQTLAAGIESFWFTTTIQAARLKKESLDFLRALADRPEQPIDMVLHCPNCGTQHIDQVDSPENSPDGFVPGETLWMNPPHRSHLCRVCGHIWRPADVPTNGVAAIKTVGKADSPVARPEPAQQWSREELLDLVRDIAPLRHQATDRLRGRIESAMREARYDWPFPTVEPQEPAQPVAWRTLIKGKRSQRWLYEEFKPADHWLPLYGEPVAGVPVTEQIQALTNATPSHPAPSEPLCPSCKGSGEMEVMERVEGIADQAWPATVDCYRCGGTGVAPSEAGAERQEYWCPFKDSACGDDPAKRCADCAQPAKGDAS